MINLKNLIKILVVGTIAIAGIQMLLLEISEPPKPTQLSEEAMQKRDELKRQIEEAEESAAEGERLVRELKRQEQSKP
ncbi:MAG: hypothetical protein KME13_11485 [Myxacorys californica WJT36-NPBG1]|jgi:DNA-binding transcriptional MerR regulator|nr:hypothetical protein [Myxacorys californica WJT36-NPBG1]